MQSRGSHQLTHGSRPKECEVSRYRHGCDPPDDVNLSRRPPQRSRIADFSFQLSNLHSFLADTIPWSRLTVHDVSSGPVHVTMESVLGDSGRQLWQLSDTRSLGTVLKNLIHSYKIWNELLSKVIACTTVLLVLGSCSSGDSDNRGGTTTTAGSATLTMNSPVQGAALQPGPVLVGFDIQNSPVPLSATQPRMHC